MPAILETKDLRKEFGLLVAVNDVNISVETGSVLGLIGPNGAGKTTFLRMIATLLQPTSGNAKIFGLDIKKDYLEVRKKIGYMPDFFNLYKDLTIEECLEFFAKAYSLDNNIIPKKVNEVLSLINLEDKRKAFIKHLSRGMIQRMGVGVLLVHEPDVFILDEPASGLDPAARIQLKNILQQLCKKEKTVIISSHILTELSGFCTHIAIMDKGNIVIQGKWEDIQNKLVNTRTIQITVISEPESAIDIIKKFPQANFINNDGNKITIELIGSADAQAELNKFLVENNIKVAEIFERKKDLEDVFMEIAGTELSSET